MKSLLYLGVVALCALPARGDETAELRTLHTLTVIDTALTRDDLDSLIDDPLDTVILYATDLNYDPGAQLRAIRALPAYCPADCPLVRATLLGILDELDGAVDGDFDGLDLVIKGRPLLRLRAAIEALGATGTGVDTDIDLLQILLDHQSRDIRATTVRALAAIQTTFDEGTPERCGISTRLRTRKSVEGSAQVVIAIDAALQRTDDCQTIQ